MQYVPKEFPKHAIPFCINNKFDREKQFDYKFAFHTSLMLL